MKKYYSVSDIERDHKGYFFQKESMRFFRSRILDTVYQGRGGVFFVTSEKFVSSCGFADKRKYTVRRFKLKNKSIVSVTKFNSLSRRTAQKYADLMARGKMKPNEE